MSKRSSNSGALTSFESKRSRNDLVAYTNRDKALMEAGIRRTSDLMAPIMLLEGHQGEVYGCDFHPEGKMLLSTGFDRQIFVWNVYGECENIMALTGHSGAVMQALFNTDGSQIHSCSTDKTLAIWDMTTGTRVRRMKGHTNFVNSLSNNRRGVQMLCSGSDDRTVRLWDGRKKAPAATMEAQYQVTAVTFNDTAEQIISSGIDNVIKLWDLRKNRIVNTLQGHTDTVTGLSLSPDGSHVLSNSMDNSLRMWDVRPYVPGERCVKVFQGHQHNFEKNLLRCAWSKDGDLVAAGSGDRFVYIWEVLPRRILYKLPGHDGGVNDVAFSPIEPLILSASSDKTLYLGELDY